MMIMMIMMIMMMIIIIIINIIIIMIMIMIMMITTTVTAIAGCRSPSSCIARELRELIFEFADFAISIWSRPSGRYSQATGWVETNPLVFGYGN